MPPVPLKIAKKPQFSSITSTKDVGNDKPRRRGQGEEVTPPSNIGCSIFLGVAPNGKISN